MHSVLGSGIGVFIGLTLVLFGFTAFMTGQAIARTWRRWWQALPYGLLLSIADRFLTYALFDEPLLHFTGWLIQYLYIVAVILVVYRVTQARKMVVQYPWLYEPAGLFGWREKREG
ncbi:hypothetical protein SAMN06265365_104200 [Tistlia consotensis]|uniref:Branched-chain amino acid transport system ATP-binding protein n=1 Tax=Tistlia consotensis USBA 355 TaxID=560819 RepID=A0A1Y6BNM9_9PROT|nr:hypothetical protein [Tistlia consotensis]SMF21367.1 branched-chain amino acid transport system ATP-binding protein [Tistlia consotensis USBA 355]SNR46990.1 hypothetical protein SAMN06265365_104200 [Tistlia consotensis]